MDHLPDSCDGQNQEHQEQHQEQAGKKLRDGHRRARDRREPEQPCDDSDDEEQQCHLQHDSPYPRGSGCQFCAYIPSRSSSPSSASSSPPRSSSASSMSPSSSPSKIV